MRCDKTSRLRSGGGSSNSSERITEYVHIPDPEDGVTTIVVRQSLRSLDEPRRTNGCDHIAPSDASTDSGVIRSAPVPLCSRGYFSVVQVQPRRTPSDASYDADLLRHASRRISRCDSISSSSSALGHSNGSTTTERSKVWRQSRASSLLTECREVERITLRKRLQDCRSRPAKMVSREQHSSTATDVNSNAADNIAHYSSFRSRCEFLKSENVRGVRSAQRFLENRSKTLLSNSVFGSTRTIKPKNSATYLASSAVQSAADCSLSASTVTLEKLHDRKVSPVVSSAQNSPRIKLNSKNEPKGSSSFQCRFGDIVSQRVEFVPQTKKVGSRNERSILPNKTVSQQRDVTQSVQSNISQNTDFISRTSCTDAIRSNSLAGVAKSCDASRARNIESDTVRNAFRSISLTNNNAAKSDRHSLEASPFKNHGHKIRSKSYDDKSRTSLYRNDCDCRGKNSLFKSNNTPITAGGTIRDSFNSSSPSIGNFRKPAIKAERRDRSRPNVDQASIPFTSVTGTKLTCSAANLSIVDDRNCQNKTWATSLRDYKCHGKSPSPASSRNSTPKKSSAGLPPESSSRAAVCTSRDTVPVIDSHFHFLNDTLSGNVVERLSSAISDTTLLQRNNCLQNKQDKASCMSSASSISFSHFEFRGAKKQQANIEKLGATNQLVSNVKQLGNNYRSTERISRLNEPRKASLVKHQRGASRRIDILHCRNFAPPSTIFDSRDSKSRFAADSVKLRVETSSTSFKNTAASCDARVNRQLCRGPNSITPSDACSKNVDPECDRQKCAFNDDERIGLQHQIIESTDEIEAQKKPSILQDCLPKPEIIKSDEFECINGATEHVVSCSYNVDNRGISTSDTIIKSRHSSFGRSTAVDILVDMKPNTPKVDNYFERLLSSPTFHEEDKSSANLMLCLTEAVGGNKTQTDTDVRTDSATGFTRDLYSSVISTSTSTKRCQDDVSAASNGEHISILSGGFLSDQKTDFSGTSVLSSGDAAGIDMDDVLPLSVSKFSDKRATDVFDAIIAMLQEKEAANALLLREYEDCQEKSKSMRSFSSQKQGLVDSSNEQMQHHVDQRSFKPKNSRDDMVHTSTFSEEAKMMSLSALRCFELPGAEELVKIKNINNSEADTAKKRLNDVKPIPKCNYSLPPTAQPPQYVSLAPVLHSSESYLLTPQLSHRYVSCASKHEPQLLSRDDIPNNAECCSGVVKRQHPVPVKLRSRPKSAGSGLSVIVQLRPRSDDYNNPVTLHPRPHSADCERKHTGSLELNLCFRRRVRQSTLPQDGDSHDSQLETGDQIEECINKDGGDKPANVGRVNNEGVSGSVFKRSKIFQRFFSRGEPTIVHSVNDVRLGAERNSTSVLQQAEHQMCTSIAVTRYRSLSQVAARHPLICHCDEDGWSCGCSSTPPIAVFGSNEDIISSTEDLYPLRLIEFDPSSSAAVCCDVTSHSTDDVGAISGETSARCRGPRKTERPKSDCTLTRTEGGHAMGFLRSTAIDWPTMTESDSLEPKTTPERNQSKRMWTYRSARCRATFDRDSFTKRNKHETTFKRRHSLPEFKQMKSTQHEINELQSPCSRLRDRDIRTCGDNMCAGIAERFPDDISSAITTNLGYILTERFNIAGLARFNDRLPSVPRDFSRARRNVVKEIISAEADYVKHVKDIIEGYLIKARQRTDMFSEERISKIFGNIEEIYEFGKLFLLDLQKRLDVDRLELSELGSCFLRHRKGFEIYSDYCNNHPRAMEELFTLQLDSNYKRFFETCRLQQMMIEIPLDGFLLTPVQKICKYPLQIKELLEHTWPWHTDFWCLGIALETMKDVASLVNERKRKMESIEKLAQWQKTVANWQGSPLVEHCSELIYSGALMKVTSRGWKQERIFFLFDHLMVYCKKDLLWRQLLVYRGRISTDNCDVDGLPDGSDSFYGGVYLKSAFKIYDRQRDKTLILMCQTTEERALWMDAFRRERKVVDRDKEKGFNIESFKRPLAVVGDTNESQINIYAHRQRSKGTVRHY